MSVEDNVRKLSLLKGSVYILSGVASLNIEKDLPKGIEPFLGRVREYAAGVSGASGILEAIEVGELTEIRSEAMKLYALLEERGVVEDWEWE